MDGIEVFARTVALGIGATGFMDLWMVIRRRAFGVAPADYGLVGRWLGHMRRGSFVHARIAAADRVPRERIIGWTAHYLIGIAFAALPAAVLGSEWLRQPTLLSALAVGVGTVAAPFLLMQPGMGAGLAARHTPRPWHARFQSLLTHAVFGVGLYLTGLALRPLA